MPRPPGQLVGRARFFGKRPKANTILPRGRIEPAMNRSSVGRPPSVGSLSPRPWRNDTGTQLVVLDAFAPGPGG